MIPYFVGSTCESSDIMSVIHYFITELQHENHGNGARLHIHPEVDLATFFSACMAGVCCS
jgi:hypothetical protein